MSTTTLDPGGVTAVVPALHPSARVLLLQVRDQRRAELHEQQCFLDRLGIGAERLDCVNVFESAVPALGEALAADLVVLGGAGAHSAYVDYPFTEPLADLVRELAERGRPFFGACFGHQFLARALGGTVVHDPANEEVGTFELRLTPEGVADPVLAGVPATFAVHLGHHDRVDVAPGGLVTLASTERCTQQLVRLEGKPVYGAQFHCEMTEEHMRERVMMYASDYLAVDDPAAEIARRLAPTPWADQLLVRFAAEYV